MAEVKRLARPERIRFSLADDATGATPLQLPEKRTWSIALFIGVMFAVFAGIEWKVIAEISDHDVRNVFDLMFVLFQGFWALGWAVAVAILGGLTVLFCLYSESTRLQGGRLVNVPRLGPLKIILEYDLARVRNIRLESAGSRNVVRIKFDYGQGSRGLGNTMPRSEAERLADIVTRAAAAAGATETLPPAPVPETPRPKRAPSTSPEPLPPLSIRSP